VRFVSKKNSDPQLCVLFPDTSSSQPRFLLQQLPFEEDLRGFTFASFEHGPTSRKPSTEQVSAMMSLVDTMEINGSEFVPEALYNPVSQRVRQTVLARVKDETAPLAEIDPRVRSYMEQSSTVLQNAAESIQKVHGLFELTKVEKFAGKKRKHFWSDVALAGSELSKVKSDVVLLEDEVEVHELGSTVTGNMPTTPTAPTKVGSVKPVEDFLAMTRHEDRVEQAIQSMILRIREFVVEGGTLAYYRKAVDCLEALRKGCLANSDSDTFNLFLSNTVKDQFSVGPHTSFWDEVVTRKVTLISSEEDFAVDTSPEEAIQFLHQDEDEQAAAPTQRAQPAEASEDELFDDIE